MDAFRKSIASTQWVLSLPYPPPPRPTVARLPRRGQEEEGEIIRSSGGHAVHVQSLDLVSRAAWGHPEVWPAHVLDAASFVQMAGLKNKLAIRAAMPDKMLPCRPA